MILEICKNKENKEQEEIGEYKGMKMWLEISMSNFILTLKNNSSYKVNLGNDVYGNITRIDNVVADMEKLLNKAEIELENLKQQFENAKEDVKIPFDKEQELQEQIKELAEVNKKLEIKDNESEIIEDEVENTEDNEKEKGQDYDRDPYR